MTDAELGELLAACPTLFHMAEAGSWDSIRRHGLLSTQALLEKWEVDAARRERLLSSRRAASEIIEHPVHGRAVIRDNGPIDEAGLRRCLRDGVDPSDWFRLLNARAFFWLDPKRVRKLLGAKLYRHRAHDVIEVDAAALVSACRDRIELSPINSGALGPFPAPRGRRTFLSIADYPYAERRRTRGPRDCVAELTVPGGVPDIARFVRRVARMRGAVEEAVVFEV